MKLHGTEKMLAERAEWLHRENAEMIAELDRMRARDAEARDELERVQAQLARRDAEIQRLRAENADLRSAR